MTLRINVVPTDAAAVTFWRRSISHRMKFIRSEEMSELIYRNHKTSLLPYDRHSPEGRDPRHARSQTSRFREEVTMASQIATVNRKAAPSLFRAKARGLLTLVALGASLAACAQPGTVRDLTVKDWVGSTEPALLASWGQPHHSYPMVAGGKMIGYQFTDNPVAWTPRGQMHTRVRNCMVNFETNAAGIILDATATGSSCTIGPHSQMHPSKS